MRPVRLPVKPGIGVEVNRELVLEENRTPHSWKNPVWRHRDGARYLEARRCRLAAPFGVLWRHYSGGTLATGEFCQKMLE